VPARAKTGLAQASDHDGKKAEAIIRSMTAQERRRPEIMDASRRRRVARGSGTEVRDVNDLLKNFDRAREMARRLKTAQKRLLRLGK
jgi:signal recognition particle subunit SRP54